MHAGTSQLTPEPQALTPTPPKAGNSRRKLKGKARELDNLSNYNPAAPSCGSNAANIKEDIVENEPTWPWVPLAEVSVNRRPPIFTKDCRYFFLITGASVKIYATATGQVVSTLSSSSSGSASSSRQADSHTYDITAALIDPRNAFQLITASLDGKIKIWDYLEASLLSTVDVGEPITHMCAHATMRNHVFIATTAHKKSRRDAEAYTNEHSKVYRVSLLASKHTAHMPIHKSVEVLKVGKMKSTTGLAVSPSGAWLVAIGGPKAYVCAMATLRSGFTKFVSNETLTCLAFHPTEEYFATGDQKGQIRLWYCLDVEQTSMQSHEEKRAQTTTLHWHAHAVSSIAFTPNGSYLLSGGEEAVLVIWQIHTGKREVVPRVGAPILSVSVASPPSAEEEYLLALADGTLTFIGAGSLRVSRSIARIKLDANSQSSGPAPLAVHVQTSTLILPSSHPSSLLIYSPLTSTLLAELEVSPSNRVSRRDEKQIEPFRVDRVAVSDSGEWLATIDRREGDEDFEREIHMKIWRWDPPSSSWNLNSRIDRPHGAHNVNGLAFAPAGDRPLLVSIGNDGNVKIWRTKMVHHKNEQEVFWICRSTLGYRSQIPTDAVCSPDGSLLAVAYGLHLVVFELSNNLLRLVLTCPEVKEISQLTFVGSSGRYVVVGGHQDIALWDLVTASVRWHHSSVQTILNLIPHPKKESFVVMYSGHHPLPTLIRTFDAASPTPTSSPTLPFNLRQVVWYPYTASSDGFTLVGITESWHTVLFGDRISVPEQEGLSARAISSNMAPHRRNIFEDIFGTSAFQDFSFPAPPSVPLVKDVAADDFKEFEPLNAPAYLLPPLQTLYTPLIEGLLRKRTDKPFVQEFERQEREQEHVGDEDVVMTEPSPDFESARAPWKEEMDEFVQFFKQQMFSSTQESLMTLRKMDHINGNGVMKVVNGSHRRKTTPTAVQIPTSINGKSHPPKSSVERTEHVSDSSPSIVGKKRKKSLG